MRASTSSRWSICSPLDRRLHLPAGDDRRRGARARARRGNAGAERARAAAPDLSRDPATVLDLRPVDDRDAPAAPTSAVARPVRARTRDGGWRLYGRKWFTSAITGQMALTLARPEGNGRGGKRPGAVLPRDARRARPARTASGVTASRTSSARARCPPPSSTLDGTPADAGRRAERRRARHRADAQRHAHLERVCARRVPCAARSRWRATTRAGASRSARRSPDQPLHLETLAGLQAEFEAAFQLTFLLVELLGRDETGSGDDGGSAALLRLLTPLAKLTTGKQAVAVRQRGARVLRRRRLRRGHRPAAAAARRAGAADLGGHHQRAVARRLLRAGAGLAALIVPRDRRASKSLSDARLGAGRRAWARWSAPRCGCSQDTTATCCRRAPAASRSRSGARCSSRCSASTRSGCSNARRPPWPRRGAAYSACRWTYAWRWTRSSTASARSGQIHALQRPGLALMARRNAADCSSERAARAVVDVDPRPSGRAAAGAAAARACRAVRMMSGGPCRMRVSVEVASRRTSRHRRCRRRRCRVDPVGSPAVVAWSPIWCRGLGLIRVRSVPRRSCRRGTHAVFIGVGSAPDKPASARA